MASLLFLERVWGIPVLEKTFGVLRAVDFSLSSNFQPPGFFGVDAIEEEVICSFFSPLTKRTPVGALPAFSLEAFPCLDAIVGKSLDKHINFRNGLGLPNSFPDDWIRWDVGNIYRESIVISCGVGLGILSPASLILPFFFEGGFPL
jgi:hypothetical protein